VSNKYRFDSRTRKQFEKDIKEGTEIESEIISRFVKLFNPPKKYKNTGCDNTGRYLEKDEVNTQADYEIEGIGAVEIKFSKPFLGDFFHLKVSQVRSYLKQNATILMVHGTNHEIPEYVLIDLNTLQTITKKCPIVNWKGFGGKKAYRIRKDMFIWAPLN